MSLAAKRSIFFYNNFPLFFLNFFFFLFFLFPLFSFSFFSARGTPPLAGGGVARPPRAPLGYGPASVADLPVLRDCYEILRQFSIWTSTVETKVRRAVLFVLRTECVEYSLPSNLLTDTSKKLLKTHLFQLAFGELNPQMPKVFRQPKTPKGVDTTPLDFCLPVRIFWKYFSWICFRGQGIQRWQCKNYIFIAWPWKSRSNTFLHDLSYLRLQTWYKVDLGVDSNIFEVKDIKNVEINHVTLTVDLGTQGHTHSLFDLH